MEIGVEEERTGRSGVRLVKTKDTPKMSYGNLLFGESILNYNFFKV